MAGIVTLGNRAYERINKVLELFGTETVNDIDLGSAFPVHPLDAVVQASLVDRWYFVGEDTTGAGTVRILQNPTTFADWGEVIRNEEVITAQAGMPDLDLVDLWLCSVFATGTTGNISNVAFSIVTSLGPTFNASRPITNGLNQVFGTAAGEEFFTTDTEEYYILDLPHRWSPSLYTDLRARIVWTAAGTLEWVYEFRSAPKGVIPVVPGML